MAIPSLKPTLSWLCPASRAALQSRGPPYSVFTIAAPLVALGSESPHTLIHKASPSTLTLVAYTCLSQLALASSMPTPLSARLLLIGGRYKHSCRQPGRCWSITRTRSKATNKHGCGRVRQLMRTKRRPGGGWPSRGFKRE